jgi:phage terminase large subunit-like protein
MEKMAKKKEETEKRIDEAISHYWDKIVMLVKRIDKVKTLEELEEIDEEEKKIYKEIEKKHKGKERLKIFVGLADIAKWYNIKYEGKFSRFTGMRPVNF